MTIWRVRVRVSVMWVTIWYLNIFTSEENSRVSALLEIRPAPSFDFQAVVFKNFKSSPSRWHLFSGKFRLLFIHTWNV